MQLFLIVLIIYLLYKLIMLRFPVLGLTKVRVMSATSVFGNELTPTNRTQIPSFFIMISKKRSRSRTWRDFH
jgi:hypothetical protein